MKNAIFIHAANMARDVNGNPNLGLCQKILDRISFFIMDSKIYEDVEFICLGYTYVEGLVLNVPKSKIVYHGPEPNRWEFPTIQLLREYCKQNDDANVLYLHTQAVSQGFNHPKIKMLNERRDYHLYWNITKYKEALQHLQTNDTCGAMLVPLNADIEQDVNGDPNVLKIHDNPVWHYSQNFWWSTAKYINTLPDPKTYPLILDERHQAEFWLCSSTEHGTHKSIHNIYDSWCYAENFTKEKYMDISEIEKFS